ncbi:MAG TPA: hypothetical protein VFS67_31185 [Polyangiaceae bacterium]|nr:hypothetical protein [Polyangiaceae bacterium]
MRPKHLSIASAALLAASGASAQAQQPPTRWAAPPPPPLDVGSDNAPPGRPASTLESASLYVSSAAYGLGMGVWIDSELGLDDPAFLLIPPTLLGVALPVTAYAFNHPTMPRGLPGAIASGLVIGAGEGLGIASLQMVTSEQPWGFHGLSRAVALGSTVGGVAGLAVGELQRPSPNISVFAASGVFWGAAVGSAVGLGVSPAGVGFESSNDWMARGGLIGFNAGLAITMGLSTVFVPTLAQLKWMWIGGAVGGVASLPVYLFYVGDDSPPAKRGLVYSATATTVGIVVGGVFGPMLGGGIGLSDEPSRWASIDYFTPVPLDGGFGFNLGGTLF